MRKIYRREKGGKPRPHDPNCASVAVLETFGCPQYGDPFVHAQRETWPRCRGGGRRRDQQAW